METVPQSIFDVISKAKNIGFTGSRYHSPIYVLEQLLGGVNYPATIFVGDANGVDSSVILTLRAMLVTKPDIEFDIKRFLVTEKNKSAYAIRSIKMVKTLSEYENPLLIGLPHGCPDPRLKPSPKSSKCFSGYGSGTWASIAYAVGLGIPTISYSRCSLSDDFTYVPDQIKEGPFYWFSTTE